MSVHEKRRAVHSRGSVREEVGEASAHKGRWRALGAAALATLVFSVFRRADAFFSVADWLAEHGWSLIAIIVALVVMRMVLSGIVTLFVLPALLGFGRPMRRLPRFLEVKSQGLLLGVLSFLVFCLLAAAISMAMGIFLGDGSVILARPDIRPDPDVVGWAYFLVALVPAIWEELAFRGWLLSRLQDRFSTNVSILLSTVFFGLFHLTMLLTESPATALGGVVMAVFFGLSWGVMTVKTGSVLPAMVAHYLVDAVGQVFINVDGTDPALAAGFFLLLTLAFPLVTIPLMQVRRRRRDCHFDSTAALQQQR